MYSIVRRALKSKFNGSISDVNSRCLEWNKVESIKLSINSGGDVHSSNLHMDHVSPWDVLELLHGEALSLDNMD